MLWNDRPGSCHGVLFVVLRVSGWPLTTLLAQSPAAVCLTAAAAAGALGPHAAVALAAAAHQVELDVI